MPAAGIRLHAAVLSAYACVAALFSWPLPLHFTRTFLGPPDSDLGVYVWNLWVFRHEIVSGGYPFLTSTILPLGSPVPLAVHNYTPVANVLALLLSPVTGIAGAFNVLTLASAVLAAYAMFLMMRRAAGDPAAAWVAGLAFGFSPFMSARAMEHFSLVQSAPLPLFVLLFDRVLKSPSVLAGAAAGACVGWAFLSDPYYAVYCVLIAGVMTGAAVFDVRLVRVSGHRALRRAVTVLLVLLAFLIVAVMVRGGGLLEVLGVRISVTHVYTPVLAFVALLVLRVALAVRPEVTWRRGLPSIRSLAALAAACTAVLLPVLPPMVAAMRGSRFISPPVLWRSSAPGVDLMALVMPNPLHPAVRGMFHDWLRALPGGFVENVAAIPWTVIALIAAAILAGRKLPRFWLLFTALFLSLALGPFIRVAGVMTYLPTPWTFLRYVPILGAARMPQRFSILVTLGAAVLAGYALRELRARSPRPALLAAAVSALLILELLPAPRTLYSAEVPGVYRTVAEDPRPVRVLDLPFGIRDGLTSYGNTNAGWQYYQTLHEKPILGGYLSRLPTEDVKTYAERPITRALMTLSEGRALPAEDRAAAVADATRHATELRVGYVVADVPRCSPALIALATEAFALVPVATDGAFTLYRSTRLE